MHRSFGSVPSSVWDQNLKKRFDCDSRPICVTRLERLECACVVASCVTDLSDVCFDDFRVHHIWEPGGDSVLWDVESSPEGVTKVVNDVSIPPSARELCYRCFYFSRGLSHVRFGSQLLLERIGVEAFCMASLEEITIPDSVRDLCDKCFHKCERLSSVRFGPQSLLERIGANAFSFTNLDEISIPDSTRELCDRCFYRCKILSRVRFGSRSLLVRIGIATFGETNLAELFLPNSVRELCDKCFYMCKRLSRVVFDQSPSLEHIGEHAFAGSIVGQVRLPHNQAAISALKRRVSGLIGKTE